MSSTFFGIDVSKDKLDIADADGRLHQTVSNSKEGIETLVDLVSQYTNPTVIVESTGGLERLSADIFLDEDIDVCVVNPRQARDFAKACGRLEKTDKIDASGLAQMGESLQLHCEEKSDEEHRRLKELSRFRDQLIEQRTQLKNQRQQQSYEDLEGILNEQIESLDNQIDVVEDKIDKILSCSVELEDKARRLQTVPGVGKETAHKLLANFPELGELNRKQAAKLAGVAPLSQDSGTHRGSRRIRGGRPRVREALYMAALNAKKWCEPIKHFYNRLLNRGKAKKKALVACMRKLVTILNSMERHQTSFDPTKAMPA